MRNSANMEETKHVSNRDHDVHSVGHQTLTWCFFMCPVCSGDDSFRGKFKKSQGKSSGRLFYLPGFKQWPGLTRREVEDVRHSGPVETQDNDLILVSINKGLDHALVVTG